MFYGARWYDQALGRFIQADSIVPGGVQGPDRYAYVNNNPLNYTDPSGNVRCDLDGYCGDPGKGGDFSPWANTTCDSVLVNGKKCYIIESLGNWNISTYNYSLPSDETPNRAHSGEMVIINVCNPGGGGCKNIAEPYRFWYGSEGIAMTGTGILPNGGIISGGNWNGNWESTTINGQFVPYDYFRGSGTFEWSYGQPGRPLQPYFDAAVGPLYKGGYYYIPELNGYKGNNGVFYGLDSGGGIHDGTIDIFTGTGFNTRDKYLISINNTPVYRVICPE
jgi:hypothetical protein